MEGDRVKRFELTWDHLKLLGRMYVSWCGDEFGAPEIDPKRPYGNSDVLDDMREILEPEVERVEKDWGYDYPGSKWTDEALRALHKETKTALQIVLRIGDPRPGSYVADDYREDWRQA